MPGCASCGESSRSGEGVFFVHSTVKTWLDPRPRSGVHTAERMQRVQRTAPGMLPSLENLPGG